jgi:hypothetical protein
MSEHKRYVDHLQKVFRNKKIYQRPNVTKEYTIHNGILKNDLQHIAVPCLDIFKRIGTVENSSGNILNTGQGISTFLINPSDLAEVHNTWLQLNLRETGSSNPVGILPGPLCIKRIRYELNGIEIQVQHGMELYLNYLMLMDADDKKQLEDETNVDLETFGARKMIKAGESKVYFIPLHVTWLNQVEPCIEGFNDKLKITIEWNDCDQFGSGTLDCTGIHLLFKQREGPTDYQRELVKLWKSPKIYPDIVDTLINEQQVSLTAGSPYEHKLTFLDGFAPFIMVFARTSNTVGSSMYQFLNLKGSNPGSDVTFEIKNATGNSLTAGYAMSGQVLKSLVQNKYFSTAGLAEVHDIYIINFAENPLDSITRGTKKGGMLFTGTESLIIKPGEGAASNAVLTVTPSGTAASGSYKIFFRDRYTNRCGFTAPLAYNASASDIKTALEALPWFRGTVAVSGALTSAATFTFSGAYAATHIAATDLTVVGSNVNTSSPADVTFTTSITTPGYKGFTSGTVYLTVIAPIFKVLKFEDGNFVGKETLFKSITIDP